MQPTQPMPEPLGFCVPWQQREPVRTRSVDDRPIGVRSRRRRQQTLTKHDRAQPFGFANPDSAFL